MDKSIDQLVPDIYALFNQEGKEQEQIDFNVDLFHEFGENMKVLMDDRFHTVRGEGRHLRMSNIGRPDRQLWYDINGEGKREAFLPQTLIKFAYGDLIEQMILLYAKMAGHKVEQEQAEIEVDGIKGHIDAIIDGVVVDVKSASSFSFQKFESGTLFLPGNDPFGYVAQLAGYIEAKNPVRPDGSGGRGGFLAVDKTLGKICFLEIPRDVLDRYKVRERITHIKKVVADKEHIPARCYPDVPDGKSGNMKLGTGCSYCPHKFVCWPGLKTYIYSTGPRYLTRVVREPKVNNFEDEGFPPRNA